MVFIDINLGLLLITCRSNQGFAMARLFAITPTRDDFAQAVLSDIRAGIYDAAVLREENTGRPYALFAPMTPEQIASARSLSFSRKQPFYREGDFSATFARTPAEFEKTRLFIGNNFDGARLATGSLDSCAFFGIHYMSSEVWTEELDGKYKLTLTAKFRKLSSNSVSSGHENACEDIRAKSNYLRHLNI